MPSNPIVTVSNEGLIFFEMPGQPGVTAYPPSGTYELRPVGQSLADDDAAILRAAQEARIATTRTSDHPLLHWEALDQMIRDAWISIGRRVLEAAEDETE